MGEAATAEVRISSQSEVLKAHSYKRRGLVRHQLDEGRELVSKKLWLLSSLYTEMGKLQTYGLTPLVHMRVDNFVCLAAYFVLLCDLVFNFCLALPRFLFFTFPFCFDSVPGGLSHSGALHRNGC